MTEQDKSDSPQEPSVEDLLARLSGRLSVANSVDIVRELFAGPEPKVVEKITVAGLPDADDPLFLECFEESVKAHNLPLARKHKYNQYAGGGYRSPFTQWCWEISFHVVNLLRERIVKKATAETQTEISSWVRPVSPRCEMPAEWDWHLVPFNPDVEQWDGLARAIMMWQDMSGHRPTPRNLFYHLKMMNIEVPPWMEAESELHSLDSVVSKGTRCALIYKAMLYDFARGNTWARNRKNGDEYEILGVATNCTNDHAGQKMQIYKKGGQLFVREAQEFHEKFELMMDSPGEESPNEQEQKPV